MPGHSFVDLGVYSLVAVLGFPVVARRVKGLGA